MMQMSSTTLTWMLLNNVSRATYIYYLEQEVNLPELYFRCRINYFYEVEFIIDTARTNLCF